MNSNKYILPFVIPFLAMIAATLMAVFSSDLPGIAINVGFFLVPALATRVAFRKYNQHNKEIRYLRVLPGVWTSMGVLGTFVTLVINVWISLSGGDGLQGVMEDASFIQGFVTAFTTSIVGILGSLAARWVLLEEEKEYDASIPEYEQQSERYYLSQLLALQQKNTETSDVRYTKLRQALDNITHELKANYKVGVEMRKDLAQAVETVQSFAPNVTELLGETMGGIQTQFQTSIDNMSSTTGDNIKASIDALTKELGEQLKATNKAFQTQQSDFIEENNMTLLSMTEKVEEKLLDIANQMKNQAVANNKELSETLDLQRKAAKEQMDDFASNMQDQMTDAQEIVKDEFIKLFEAVNRNLEKLQTNALETLQSYTQGLEKSFESMKDIVDEMGTNLTKTDEQSQDLYAKFEDVNTAFDNTVAQFDGLVKQSNLAYSTIGGFSKSVDTFKDTINEITTLEHQYLNNMQKIRDLTKVLEVVVNSVNEVESALKTNALFQLNK